MLKNITVCSSYDEPSQIGEGVEMVNGILDLSKSKEYSGINAKVDFNLKAFLDNGVDTIMGMMQQEKVMQDAVNYAQEKSGKTKKYLHI